MKVMILAAGRGERLRPLTDTTAKPLVKVGSRALIEYNLLRLKQAGIKDIVINLSYHAKQISRFLGNGVRYGVNIEYSSEGDKRLGTGGGIKRALPLLGEEPFWVVSADIWSEFDFSSVALKPGIDVHLVMVPNPEFHPEGDYGICSDGRLVKAEPKFNYSGMALMQPNIFSCCEADIFSFSPIINKAIAGKKATGSLYKGSWFNVGTMAEFNKLKKFIDTVGVRHT